MAEPGLRVGWYQGSIMESGDISARTINNQSGDIRDISAKSSYFMEKY